MTVESIDTIPDSTHRPIEKHSDDTTKVPTIPGKTIK
jgi:hypothetical protein